MTEQEPTTQLAERARSGDRRAFAELVERFREPLESWIGARLGRQLQGVLEADDVYQETMAHALEWLDSFEWRGEEAFVRWLGGIAENVMRTAAARTARRGRLQLTVEPPGHTDSPSTALRREERFDRLEEALESLPPDYREVIRLSRIEGLKHEEIAARMNRSHAAVRQLVVRALRRLREQFGDTQSLGLPGRALGRKPRNDGEG